MEDDMPEKPSYLGLLNTISLLESRAHAYLTAWADVTSEPAVRQVLLTVAAREGEHGMSFAKRINELGFELMPKEDPGFQAELDIARSSRSDLEKIEVLGVLRFCADDEPDVFDDFFRDHSIDIRTGELLGRYIAEERDSLRLLQGCRAQLQAASPAETPDRLGAVEEKLDAVARAVDELRQIVCAQTMPAGTG
jgi:rubrerythrin